ncbi:L-seryl-tRNA(Sec) selenium transferase [candidate division LCP-89 bacterium B3_LCP]|uniref:L-seryl-tRNA(Sec) selenium transferase n=1 Tax=candidate division LCP-89 bacterium B3_LCP TaxID=2012998 RepID=A0A532V5Q0_UNCL8|nr:MAG: L-seryl-tRNA(Sec) selenium transferase [candidate division LCP-89 bacterium B3_LCP]
MPEEKKMRKELLDKLPGMPALLNDPDVKSLRENHPTLYVNDIVRSELDHLRRTILESPPEVLKEIKADEAQVIQRALKVAKRALEPSVKGVINAAGVILHTALGRAPIARAAQESVAMALEGYCTLAINEETGKRGDRHLHLDRLLAHITGAEAGIVVNNNAAGTMLILNTLAQGGEVIVSRGQLIEIGGAFRIPEVMERSGCKLVEVGTTNRTHLRDYENAITEDTAAILRVHTSNYRIIGFTGEVPLPELAALGKKYNLPVIDDLGSGALVDLSQYGLPKEPMVQESVRDGMDVICFSGDKMLGGPQGGYLIGKRSIIDSVKKNPLTRALRCDKMSYAAHEATLKLYLEPDKLEENHPVLSMIVEKPESVRRRTQALRRRIAKDLQGKAELAVIPSETEMGSGSLPGKSIPSFALQVKPLIKMTPDCLGEKLRQGNPPVYTRVAAETVLFDLRTVLRGQEKAMGECLKTALA